MAVIELDPRYPTIIPLDAASLLTGDVSYTEEVPIRVRWAIADGGGHSVANADVLVTTNPDNEAVVARLEAGERHIRVGLDDAPDPVPAVDSGAAVDNDSAAEGEVAGGPEVAGGAEAAAEHPAPVGVRSTLPHVEEAEAVMARARATGQWEASQTHASLLPYLIEETYEFVDAVNEGGDILGELSDLLLQVLFHAEIAEDFDLNDVAKAFILKMRTRQPYLFDGSVAEGQMVSIEEQERAWAAGRGRKRSQPADHLPALALAEEAIRRARSNNIPDSEIPVELMCPTPGLELESGAEARTRLVARTFLAELDAKE